MAFDLDLQTCDWKANVDNCDKLSKPRNPKPDFATAEPVCPDGQLQCRSGECLDQVIPQKFTTYLITILFKACLHRNTFHFCTGTLL